MIKKITLSVLVASSLLIAAEPDVKKENTLVTHAELGYVETNGNTETKTFNLDFNLKKGFDKHIFKFLFDGQYASDSGVESKNKYYVELNYNYEFTKKFAFNYIAGYKEDKFSAFDSQFFTGPGAIYKVIESKSHNLAFDASILYSVDKYLNAADDKYSAYRAKGVYLWQINKNLKFDQELSYRGAFEDANKYFIFSKTAISSKISDIFSAGVSYKVDYINQAAGKEKTDTTITANLIMDY